MEKICEFSVINKLGQKECMVDNLGQPCAFQKYCRKDYAWKFTEEFLSCKRREKNMAKKENNVQEVKDTTEISDTTINDTTNVDMNCIEVHGKVVCICDGFVILEDDLGNGFISYKSNLKIGDTI